MQWLVLYVVWSDHSIRQRRNESNDVSYTSTEARHLEALYFVLVGQRDGVRDYWLERERYGARESV